MLHQAADRLPETSLQVCGLCDQRGCPRSRSVPGPQGKRCCREYLTALLLRSLPRCPALRAFPLPRCLAAFPLSLAASLPCLALHRSTSSPPRSDPALRNEQRNSTSLLHFASYSLPRRISCPISSSSIRKLNSSESPSKSEASISLEMQSLSTPRSSISRTEIRQITFKRRGSLHR